MDGGVYIAVFHLASGADISVGRLGRFHFEEGFYLYTGSAQRGLSARLARHGKRRKPSHWHIDYLSKKATMVGAITLGGAKQGECRLAAALARRFTRPVAGFGASDCRCGGHLFFARNWG
ncbi:MAG: GIY-YIG nuclease family protein [Planctomycetia bacterium]|nr:GIY-YIG nuclease family protein [Planctomycetia bacterium]